MFKKNNQSSNTQSQLAIALTQMQKEADDLRARADEIEQELEKQRAEIWRDVESDEEDKDEEMGAPSMR